MKKGSRDWRWAHSRGTVGEKRWISIHEAAVLLSVSESGLRKLINRDLIPIVRVARMIRVDLRKLEAQMEAQAGKGTAR